MIPPRPFELESKIKSQSNFHAERKAAVRTCTHLHMVYVTQTEAPRKEGKQSSVMKMVVIWLTR